MNAFVKMIFLCLLAFSAVAQENDDLPQPPVSKVRDKIEAARIAYITDQLALTPEEAEKFWPVYREFAQKRREIRLEGRAAARNPDSGKSDEEIVEQQFKIKQKELDLEKDYSGRLLKVISAQKLRSLPQAERRFRQMILDQIQRRQMQQDRQ
jgi:hypothetical protein